MNRRNLVGILAGVAAGPPVLAQGAAAPARGPQASGAPADAELQSAREDLKSATQRVAQVKLPRSVEPAFHFRA